MQATSACVARENCRLCGSDELHDALSLAPTPPANAFQPSQERALQAQRFALQVRRCFECGHSQLKHVVDPNVLFADYVYVSGTSPAYVAHLNEFAASAIALLDLQKGDLVVEIGSNDGTLLRPFQSHGARVQGIDPARDISDSANQGGIPTINSFFDMSIADAIVAEHGKARLVAANNVCAHVDDLQGLVAAVRHMLAADGELWLEVSYLKSVVQHTLFDTIYHEHLDYHRVAPLRQFFAANGLALWDAEPIATHGGSIRVRVAHPGRRATTARVAQLIAEESSLGLDCERGLAQLSTDIRVAGEQLNALLDQYVDAGLTGAGYGAPAKATTLMHQFGLDHRRINFIIDDSPWKQGLFSPGLGIPVVSADQGRTRKRDFMLVLAWNFAEPIMNNNRWFIEGGGKFVVPLPTLQVH
jgi:2-polyprenyl-3-methyl-5-hydroxy-6-metoxy-1,4-benzoquinol methylase